MSGRRDPITARHAAMGRIVVFCSYAHADRHHLKFVRASLARLREKAIIDDWYDGELQAADRWDDAIKDALNRAHVVLFLVTHNLLSSSYVNAHEIRIAVEREAAGECRILPILVEKPEDESLWRASPLHDFQPVPGFDDWVSDFGGFQEVSELISLGVLDACKAVGGGDNPFRRCRQGDWRRLRYQATFPTGESAEWETVETLIEKTAETASVRVRSSALNGGHENVYTCRLDVPLREQQRSFADQSGLDFSQMEAMSTRASADGPEMREELVAINLRNYETRVKSQEVHGELNGVEMTTRATHWQSLDAPFDGTVQAEQRVQFHNGPSTRSTCRLLDFGNTESGAPAPEPKFLSPLPPQIAASMGLPADTSSGAQGYVGAQSAPPAPATVAADNNPFAAIKGAWREFVDGFRESYQQATAPAIVPGRWGLQTQDQFGQTSYDVMLYPNLMLQGVCWHNGVQYQLSGSWQFEPTRRVLMLGGMSGVIGYPPTPFQLSFQLDASNASVCFASDPPGRPLQISRIS